MKRLGLALLALLLVGVWTRGHGAAPATNKEALMAADRAFDAATADRKLAGFSSFLAENASTLRADEPVVRGKQAMVEDWKPLLEDQSLSLRWHPISAEISKSGDLGYTIGVSAATRTDKAGSRLVGSGKYLTLWRMQKDGSWKVEFDTGVQDKMPRQSQ
jgi:ketosteroid isomerase-like protein